MSKHILLLILIFFICVSGINGQSLQTDGFTNAHGDTRLPKDSRPHTDPVLTLPLPRENYDALLNAVSEYVLEGKLSEEEYDQFCTSLTECTPNNPFHHPVPPVKIDPAGMVISFETTDLEGRTVRSESLFAGHKITMLNVWDTTCAACITELPDLEKFSHELEKKGAQLVGLVLTADDSDLAAEAKEIADDLGVTYVNLLPTDEIKALFPVQSFPTTFFVSEKGELIGDPVIGARMDKYRTGIEKLISKQ